MSPSDFRYAWRSLSARHNRAFTLATVLTFALGIGAASAIFSIVHAVLLAPLPFHDAERVTYVYDRNLSRGLPEFSVSTPNFLSWQERAKSFESLAGLNGEGVNLGTAQRVERVQGMRGSASLWQTLGVTLLSGRAFTTAEDTLGGPAVAILGEGIWRTRFGADAGILGRSIMVNGTAHTVVGIAPQDVGFATDIDVWLPLTPDPVTYGRGDRRLTIVGRLADGVSLAQAQAELDGISAALAREFPEANAGWTGAVASARDWIVGADVRGRLLLMLAAVLVLMLVACTNVANLQVARSTARQREVAVRQALGASRGRLLGQMVAENLMLAAIGGALGVALAYAAIQAAVAVLPAATPRLAAYALDWRAVVIATAASALTAFVFGLVPMLVAMRRQVGEALQQLGRSTVDGQRTPLRQALVVVQFALATVLVAGAALLTQHFMRLQDTSLGFRPDNLLVARLTLPQESEEMDLTPHYAIYQRLLQDIGALPGVRAVGITSEIPLGDFNTSMMIAAGAGGPLTYTDDSTQASWRVVSSDYLNALGVPLLRGRNFAAENETARSIILSEGLAAKLFPGADPVGQTIRLGNGQWRNVIGVAGDVRQQSLGEDPTPTMYMPITWLMTPTMSLAVRAEGDPTALIAPIRAVAERASPEQPLFDIQTMTSVMSTSVAEPRVQTLVLLAFAAASLLLAAFGVAGVTAYLVARRAPELAVRMALGASPRRLVAHVLRGSTVLCLVGVVVGTTLLLASSSLWKGFAGNASAITMVTLGAGVLLIVGLVACWLPARRVAAISPSSALRDE